MIFIINAIVVASYIDCREKSSGIMKIENWMENFRYHTDAYDKRPKRGYDVHRTNRRE